MLSNMDIKRELGKNLFIYPLTPSNIKGASINLTASPKAWSLAKKQSIAASDGMIHIPPHDTGLIETEEVVCISNKLAGTYHSRVKTVSTGTGHIGTTMNPGWIGRSLIAVHNHTEKEVTIPVGSPFVTVALYYLKTKATIQEDNPAGRSDILQDFPLTEEERDWLYEQDYALDKDALKKEMKETPAYKEIEKETRRVCNYILAFGLVLFLAALVVIYFCIPAANTAFHEFWILIMGACLPACAAGIVKLLKQ